MSTSTPSKPGGWFTGRTRLITIVSIVGVALAGASAVSANLGILDTASTSPVGNASVAGDLTTPTDPQVLDVYLPADTTLPAPATTTAPAEGSNVQEFAVDIAGTVGVESTATGLRLDQVTPAAGWTWTLSQSSPTELMVTLTNGTRTFEFTATQTADGNIAASVSEPIVSQAPAAGSGGYGGDDDEHEGHDEYEGGDDDD